MNRRAAEARRAEREAQRRGLTVSDAHRINEMRRLPTDHPSRGMRNHKDTPSRARMVYPIYTSPEQAWRYLRVIRACPEARRVIRRLCSHPGPQARCRPEVILLAMLLAAEIKGRYLRSDLCSIINGLDATILFHLGLCNSKTFKPVAYSVVVRQVLRLERTPFGRLLTGQGTHEHDDDPDDESKVGADAIGLTRFCAEVLLASIPKQALAKTATARSVSPEYAAAKGMGA